MDERDEYDDLSPPPLPRSNPVATAAMVVGIVGIVLCWVPGLNLLILLTAIVLGIIGLNNRPAKAGIGKGPAVAGLAMGGAGFVLALIVTLIAILLPALSNAREVANRARSASQMMTIQQGLFAYAVDHKAKFPKQLGVLITDGYASPHSFLRVQDRAAMSSFPDDANDVDAINAWIETNSPYIYVWSEKGLDLSPSSVVLYERPDLNGGKGITIGYGDGHVKFEDWPDAVKALSDSGINVPANPPTSR